MGDYNLNLSGSTGLDQTIDYSGKIKLPASTGISKLMTLDLKIGGSFTSPKVSVDTKSMANQALESVADEAISHDCQQRFHQTESDGKSYREST